MRSSPYFVLGVPEDSSIDVCKDAYRRLSKKHHPDSGGDANKFAMVVNAWTEIKDGSAVSSKHRSGITHSSVFSFRKTN